MLVKSFVLMKPRMNMKIGHVGSKTRSLGHILEKPCVCSKHQIFSLDTHEIWSEFLPRGDLVPMLGKKFGH